MYPQEEIVMLDLKIITGMSGAGKSQFLRMMEDLGYYTVDHLPVELTGNLIETLCHEDRRIEKAAMVVDIRESGHFNEFFAALDKTDKRQVRTEVIFLEADRDVVLRRFRETRRRHPLGKDMRVLAAIDAEEKIMAPIRSAADRIINTSLTTSPQMQEIVNELFGSKDVPRLMINIVSFGFKYGMPLDLDFMFDVRFLPNPFYETDLKAITGLDQPVTDFVLKDHRTVTFLAQLEAMIPFLLKSFESVMRDNLVIGFGCTGGQHRSVALAEEARKIVMDAGYLVTVTHRDIWRVR